MAIDPSIALGIRPLQLADPLAQYSQFAQIQNAQNQNALAQYQLGAAQRADEMDRITSEAYKNSLTPEGTVNYNLLAANLSRGGAGKLVPAVLAAKAEQEVKSATLSKTRAETEELERKSREAKFKALGTGLLRGMSNPDDATLNSIFDDLDSNGVDTKGIRQQFAQIPDLNQRINVIKNYALSNEEGRKALEFVSPKPEKFDIGGKIVVLDMNPNSQTYKQEIQGYAKTLTPGESKPVISNVDVGNEVVTQSYDPVTGKITILERRPKGLTPGEARPQPSTVDLGGTVETRVFDPATGTFKTVSTEQKTAAPAAPTELARLQAERDALPLDDPRRNELDKKIAKETEKSEPARYQEWKLLKEQGYKGSFQDWIKEQAILSRTPATPSAPTASFDKQTGQMVFATREQILANPGRFLPPTEKPEKITANSLRDEYNSLTKDFRAVQDAHTKITTASPTGAGDMSLLYNYVKLLDPTSVVRESEFAAAAASGSFGERVQGAVNRVQTGQRLTENLRKDFINEANNLYKAQKVGADRLKAQYLGMAERSGLNPKDVIVDYSAPAAEPEKPSASAKKVDIGSLPPKVVKDGVTYILQPNGNYIAK